MSATVPFDFPPLEAVRQNLRVKWYRCPIDPARLRQLMTRSNLQGAFQTLGHLALFAAAGAATAYFFTSGMWLWFALAFWCQGTIGRFYHGVAPHELGHGTVFKTKWLNRFFLRVLSLISFWNYHEYAMSHTYHHRYTLFPDGDREVLLPRGLRLTALTVIQLLTVNVTGAIKTIRETVRMALPHYNLRRTERGGTEWTEALFSLAPEVRRRSVRWARLTLLFHGGLLAASAVFGVWWLSLVLTGYLFVGNWLVYLLGSPMHIGLMDNVPDFRLSVRSNRLDPFSSFLYWRMNWHTEHHMFAGVPCYHLRKLAREIERDMPELRSLWTSWREMIRAEKRRRREPTYQFLTSLPPTAHPAVLRPEDLEPPRDGSADIEASIGELAPTGQ